MAEHEDLNLLRAHAEEQTRDYVSLLESFPYRPTLYIGLGGTGVHTVDKIRELFLKLVAPQARAGRKAGVADIDPRYAFLGFDTSAGECPSGLAKNRDWFHLGIRNLKQFYSGMGAESLFKDWIVPSYPSASIISGASGFRNLGRMVFIRNVDRVYKALDQKRQQIMGAASRPGTMPEASPTVYIFCSLSGGTGSGTLLDTCFLLRELFDDAQIIGMLGVLDGLPTMPRATRERMRVNTFCGLKELDAFMSRKVPSEYEYGGPIQYPFNIEGRIEEPFDECYLITPNQSDGTCKLPTHAHVTSFLARQAFMMSAFSYNVEGDTTPDYAGIMVNHSESLTQYTGGARTAYCVPGLAQVHFPVETVVNTFVFEAASSYIRYQKSGTAPEGEREAKDFMSVHDLDFKALRVRIGRDPKASQGGALKPRVYDDTVADLFSKRYENRDRVLSLGDKYPAMRLKEIQAQLSENVDSLVESLVPRIKSTMSSMLVDPEFLGLGAQDFVQDLRGLLLLELEHLRVEGSDLVDRRYEALATNWRQHRKEVDDVCTKDNALDAMRDAFKAGRVQLLFTTFLNEAEEVVLEKAKNELAKSLLMALDKELDEVRRKLSFLFGEVFPQALEILDQRARELHTRLYRQTQGADDSVESVHSINVMTQEWREAYYEKRGLSSRTILESLLKSNWHPADLISDEELSGGDSARVLAQRMLDLIEPLFDHERTWTPIDVMELTEKYRGKTPDKIISEMYYNYLRPQMKTWAMENRLSLAPWPLIFCGGLNAKLREQLEGSDEFQGARLSMANNHELNRINFFSTTLPIALAGCDEVLNTFEPAYNRWLRGLDKMPRNQAKYETRLYHSFPGSLQWPSPTEYHGELASSIVFFARALALADILDLNEEDEERMKYAAKNPKEHRYGIFQYGRAQFWMWPFFPPHSRAEIKEKPVRLGANIYDAYLKFSKNPKYMSEAKKWADWLEENWSQMYKGPEIHERIREALKGFQRRKGTATDPRWLDLWARMITSIEKWDKIG